MRSSEMAKNGTANIKICKKIFVIIVFVSKPPKF